MNVGTILRLTMISAGLCAAADQPVTFDFDNDTIDQPPPGWTSYATGGGPAGKWLVKKMDDAPSGKNVVVQTDPDRTDTRFPVLIAEKGEYADLDLSIKGKAISGKIDQGIGLVFRFRDPKSYYVMRANALENNVRLYKMVNGRRLQFAGFNTRLTSGVWHTLRAVAKGDQITGYYDGRQVISARDKTYSNGKVGLWTKADSVIAFDDVRVTPVH